MQGNIDAREIWLMYFNNTLLENGVINQKERDKMAQLIRKKCHTSIPIEKGKDKIKFRQLSCTKKVFRVILAKVLTFYKSCELCRRGYSVNIGKTSNGEIDFIAEEQGDKIYVHVTKEIKTEETEKREYERLLEIRDNYPKYLLRTDAFAGGNYESIKTMHIADFLLSKEF